MKKIILFLMIFCSLGIVSAQEYPDKLNGGNKFNTLEKFRGIYNEIYEDVNNEDLVEVCERTFRWPEFWIKDELIYSIKNCQELRNEGTLTEFINLEHKNVQQFNIFWNNFKTRFELERELLRIENDIRRQTGLAYIFADGEVKIKDAPFDLILDLNEIDEIFFGEKVEIPDLNFAKKTEKEMTEEIPIDDEDKWLEQIEENHEPKKDKFNNYTNNLSGSLYRMGIELFRDNLNLYPLWLAHVGKTMGDKVATDSLFTPSGFTADTHEVIQMSSDIPESLELSYEPILKLNSLIQNYILEQEVESIQVSNFNVSRVDQLRKFDQAEKENRQKVAKSLNDFYQENERIHENRDFTTTAPLFSKFNEMFNLFRGKLKNINTDVMPPFLDKPDHSS
jgi:hypothetical protein